MLDIFALSGLEWVYDQIEDRFGRAAAWLATVTLAFTIIGIAVGVIIALI